MVEENKIMANVAEDIGKADAKYTAENIEVLEGLEAVRKRPGMYIGSTSGTGLHHLVWEIVDNAIDEALAGFCDTINVIVNKDGSLTVKDNGRGIPVDVVEKTGKSAVETVYTVLHAGGKFGAGGGYKVSGGLHGVGASVVNALSTWLVVDVFKNGGHYHMGFANGGFTQAPLQRVGDSDLSGTTVTFMPDETIFTETTEFVFDTIRDRLRQMAYLNKGVRIVVEDHRLEVPVSETFHFEGGIKEYVQFLNNSKTKIPNMEEIIYAEGAETEKDTADGMTIYVEVAMQWTDTYSSGTYSFCNNINTKDGGTHEEGFRLALNRVVNDYAKKNKFIKDADENYTTDDIKEGLTTIISVKHPNPQYEGQTKGKLGSSEVRKIVSSILSEALRTFLNENPKEAAIILTKITNAREARNAARHAQESVRRKSSLEITTLPGKLADCSSKDPSVCELYIVEGNSAGGSAKNGRDRNTQAILPLRGKILNTEKAVRKKVYENAEIGNMIQAIGAGFDPEFNVEKARYHKIVIMTDADVDGSHIRVLLLTFFYRYMRDLITAGYVYIAQPPLYKVEYHGKSYYAYNDVQLEDIKTSLNLKPGYPFQRYKGLGEMDAQQLWETTMDPKTRKMIRVTIEDAIEAETVFSDLMGEEVLPRKEFISRNATFVKNLDI